MDTATMGNFGMGMSIAGAISSAWGASDAAAGQKMALSAQAQMDQINARSSALALNGQADLELINTKAAFESMTTSASMNLLGVKEQNFENEGSAALNEVGAEHSAAMTLDSAYSRAAIGTIQAGMQSDSLEAGAHIAEQNANLLEMQAQSAMLHGQYAEQNSDLQYAQVKSRATVEMARGNIDMSEGTALAQKVGIDVMSQRAAIMIQQDTLMQAFGLRTQESSMRLDAGIKAAQAQAVTAMAGVQSSTEIQLGEMQASSVMQQAKLKTALTAMNSEFQLSTAQAQSDWTAAMEKAGMLTAEASAEYKRTMAKIMVDNASAAGLVKQSMADGINPTSAFLSSALSSAGQVAGSWYSLNRTTSAPPTGP